MCYSTLCCRGFGLTVRRLIVSRQLPLTSFSALCFWEGVSMSACIESLPFLDGRANMSIDTDPKQQKAASPQMLVVRSFLR